MGSGRSSWSMNSARFSSVARISGGRLGEMSAASTARTTESRGASRSSAHAAEKDALKSSRARGWCTCASTAHGRSEGLGDSRSSSTDSRRIHSSQSSAV